MVGVLDSNPTTSTNDNQSNPPDPVEVLNPRPGFTTTDSRESTTTNNDVENVVGVPILNTGLILGGPGIPLHMAIQSKLSRHRPNTDFSVDWKLADAQIGFEAILAVLGIRTRASAKYFSFFIEGQRAQEDAVVLYLLRSYKDDIEKLDRVSINEILYIYIMKASLE